MVSLINELKDSVRRLEFISDTLNKIHNNISDEKIAVGSRVLIKWEGNHPDSNEGRVVRMKPDGSFVVKREGQGEITVGINRNGLMKYVVQNLSVGTYGKLEKEEWLLKLKIKEIQQKIDPLIKVITLSTARKIIETSDFKSWYLANDIGKTISYEKLSNSAEVLLCGLVKEYLNKLNLESEFIEII